MPAPEAGPGPGRQATPREIGEALEGALRVAVVSHARPDGDAIGSTVAMLRLLQEQGVQAVAINADPVPEGLSFLPGTSEVRAPEDWAFADGGPPDVIVLLDCAGKDRSGTRIWERLPVDATLINVDHHVSNDLFGDLNFVDVAAPATGELVFRIAEAMGWVIGPEARDNLFAAISTDTGSFRYPSTTSETFRIAAALTQAGADVGAISRHLYESYPYRRIGLLRELLQDLQLDAGGRVVSYRLPLEMARRWELKPGDTEGLIDLVRAVDSVIVAVFFEELPGGLVRVSARSKSDEVDVGKICALFGGGGHRLAAGARVQGPLDEVTARYIKEVEKTLNGIH